MLFDERSIFSRRFQKAAHLIGDARGRRLLAEFCQLDRPNRDKAKVVEQVIWDEPNLACGAPESVDEIGIGDLSTTDIAIPQTGWPGVHLANHCRVREAFRTHDPWQRCGEFLLMLVKARRLASCLNPHVLGLTDRKTEDLPHRPDGCYGITRLVEHLSEESSRI
ncbi:hypothetical protein LRH25_31660 [Ideonella azotifigens]|uniref:hypothetical protein n=1 Tax=Ideonella azotifigens TaxID=513160 RepID=UPI001142355C|nr:hypothetical protein [Ideonella azotifigens]MCD2344883.1 hypothetical protein [Ideonella azotifigens]